LIEITVDTYLTSYWYLPYWHSQTHNPAVPGGSTAPDQGYTWQL